MVFTNDFAFAQPISFAKGAFEDEWAMADYISRSISPNDIILGISASGGTGFVFELLGMAKDKGARTIAITENSDTPLGKNADVIIKSESKPEGPSSSRVQIAHLVIGYSLILTIADKRGITAERAINYMLPRKIRNKKMGIK
jgi:D-arabinose 5-phosphate isomerase GutQ